MDELKTNSRNEHTLIMMPSGRRGQIPEGMSLLDAAESMGVQIESICGGRQTCGKCHVLVEEGYYDKHGIRSRPGHLSSPPGEETQLLEEMEIPDQRLACAARVHGDLLITVPEESRAQKQIIRKTASERIIEVDPAVRKYYVEVEAAQLGKHRGDWGRLQDALEDQWGLTSLEIDLHVLRNIQPVLREKDWKVTATLWDEQRVIDLEPGYQEGAYGLAVDVGSTTVASYLTDLRTGELLAAASQMNPQVSFGEDLMSRVSFAMNRSDGLQKMNDVIIKTINTLAGQAAREAGIRARDIQEIVLVGNTTMMHLLLGINPRELGGAPFALANQEALNIPARELGLRLHPGANAYIPPAEAGHVGADNIGVLIAEEPQGKKGATLTVDIGTNAEIVLTSADRMLSASSPTGPAFEGGQISAGMRAAPGAIERVRIDPETKFPRFQVIGEEKWSDHWNLNKDASLEEQPQHLASGICGSGIIEVVAELFLSGILAPNGRFNPQISTDHMQWDEERRQGAYILAGAEQTSSGKPLLVTQEDIRNIQLAKAALYAGAKLLMKRSGVKSIDQIILAGAFGSYINPRQAMILGLIPDCDLDQVYAVGNAAGDGARIMLLNREKRREAERLASEIRYIETAVDQNFQEEFVRAIHIPHQSDEFPHLKGLLPTQIEPLPPARKRRHRRTK